jgi:polar amino acid transport system substrate-binding protein
MRSLIFISVVVLIAFALSITPGAAANITLLTEDTPPVNYLDENQKVAGLSVELVQEMARRVGDPGKIEVVPWARGYVDAREISNTALFSTAWSPERDPTFKWVGPLLTKEVVLYKKKGNNISINTLNDAKNVEHIGTYKDDSKEQLLKKKGFLNLDSTVDDIANPRKLMAGRIDLWVSTSIQAGPTCRLAGVDPDDIEPTVTLKKQLMYLAFSKSTADSVVVKWQQAFDAMQKDGTLAKIHRKYGLAANNDKMTVYTENAPPRNYLKDGQVSGYVTDIVRHILRRTGETSRIELVTWARGYKEALQKPNVALYTTIRSKARENLFHWVGPIAQRKMVFFAKKGSGIKIASLDDAKKVKSIGTYKDDIKEQFLKKAGFGNLESVMNDETNPKKLVHGRIDLWASAEDTGLLKAQAAGVNPADLEVVFTVKEDGLYIALSKQTDLSVVKVWRDALDAMHKDGSFLRILKKWGVARE